MFHRDRDSALADLKHELSTAAAELNINNEQLQREGITIANLHNLVRLLQDKGCETDVQKIDHEDGIMTISIVSPHLHGEIEEMLKQDNLVDESIRYSNTGELFKCELSFYFQVVQESDREKLPL
jgi:hypothetical protein